MLSGILSALSLAKVISDLKIAVVVAVALVAVLHALVALLIVIPGEASNSGLKAVVAALQKGADLLQSGIDLAKKYIS